MGRAGRLRIPDLTPGSALRLKRALHDLHLRAGAPSVGEIVRETGKAYSRSVVHGLFSAEAVPRRDPMMAVAEALLRRVRNADPDREMDRLHMLWQEAWADDTTTSDPAVGPGSTPTPHDSPRGRVPKPEPVPATGAVGGDRTPNTKLSDLFSLCGWSKGELARLVNQRAVEMGHAPLTVDASRVRRWIEAGEVPRAPIPMVLSALFTERLGRVVTIEDLGIPLFSSARKSASSETGTFPWSPERTAAVLVEFTGMDLEWDRSCVVVDTRSAVMLESPPVTPEEALASATRRERPLPTCALCGNRPFEPLLSPMEARGGICRACAHDVARLLQRSR